MSRPELYLASTSPRRRVLLQRAGITFALCEPGEEYAGEDPDSGAPPEQLAVDRARRKALGAACADPRVPVLAVDTVVDVDGRELGKAADRREAEAMLRRLFGRTHRVHTAHVLVVPATGQRLEEVASAVVVGDRPDEAALQRYLASDDWVGKAGGYGIQDPTQDFLRVVEGDIDTVMGLHTAAVRRLLERGRSRT